MSKAAEEVKAQEIFVQPAAAQDTIVSNFKTQEKAATQELGTTSSSITANSEKIDPITEAIRKEILERQRDALREYFENPENLAKLQLDEKIQKELAEKIKNDQEFREFLSNLEKEQDEEKRKLLNATLTTALNDSVVKGKLETTEIAGYKTVHAAFPDSFKIIAWDGPKGDTTQSQKITNDVGNEIATLNETTHRTTPISVKKSDGIAVTINSYRTIDFPTKFADDVRGSMHLSMVVLDENGNKPPLEQAVYFTAHYEEGKDGKPLLKEVSSPMPIKFIGEGKEAIGYIEHGGKIYTLPVTRGKYQEMMIEVAKNKGQSIDLSQNVELANDKFIGIGGKASGIEQNKENEVIEPIIAASSSVENKAKNEKASPLSMTEQGPSELEGSVLYKKQAENMDRNIQEQAENDAKSKLFSELPFNDLTTEEMLKEAPSTELLDKSKEKLENSVSPLQATNEKFTPASLKQSTVTQVEQSPLTADVSETQENANKSTGDKSVNTAQGLNELEGSPLYKKQAENMDRNIQEQAENDAKSTLFSELPFNDLTTEEMLKEAPSIELSDKSKEKLENLQTEIIQSTNPLQATNEKFTPASLEQATVTQVEQSPLTADVSKTQEQEFKTKLPFISREALEKVQQRVIQSTTQVKPDFSDLETKLNKATANLTEDLNLTANDPSQKLYEATDASQGMQTNTEQLPVEVSHSVQDHAQAIRSNLFKSYNNNSGPLPLSQDQQNKLIEEYTSKKDVQGKEDFLIKLVDNKSISNNDRLNMIENLITLEVAKRRKSVVENAELSTSRIPKDGQVRISIEETNLKKIQNQQGERAVRKDQIETVNSSNNVRIINKLNEAKIKINSESKNMPLNKSAISKKSSMVIS